MFIRECLNSRGGALDIEGIPPAILTSLFHTNVTENVNRYNKYLLGEIKFGLALNLLNVGDALTQNVWKEIPITNLLTNTEEIKSEGNYILLNTGHYQVVLITLVYDTAAGPGTLYTDIYDVDLAKEVDYSINMNNSRMVGNVSLSMLTSTVITVAGENKRIIPRVMSDKTTTFLGGFPASVPVGSQNFCTRTVIQKF